MKKTLSLLLGMSLFTTCSHRPPREQSKVVITLNKVLPLEGWNHQLKRDFNGFEFYKGSPIPSSLLEGGKWKPLYGISLKPLGEVEWVEHLSFQDGQDKVLVILSRGPLSEIKNKPVEMNQFAAKIPEYIETAKSIGIKKARVSNIYLLRP